MKICLTYIRRIEEPSGVAMLITIIHPDGRRTQANQTLPHIFFLSLMGIWLIQAMQMAPERPPPAFDLHQHSLISTRNQAPQYSWRHDRRKLASFFLNCIVFSPLMQGHALGREGRNWLRFKQLPCTLYKGH